MGDRLSPKGDDLVVPVYIPDNNGEPVMHVGDASLENDVLTIKFKNSMGALMLERKLARGEVMGFSVINLQAELNAVAANEPTG